MLTAAVFLCGCSSNPSKSAQKSDEMVLVHGGNTSTGEEIHDYYISKCEVTQKQWKDIMKNNPSSFQGDSNPVESVSWYQAIEFCNQWSKKEGKTPYYTIDKQVKDSHNKSEYDTVKWSVTENKDANGYRLPTIDEWEYAASGGTKSKKYTYSGGNDAGKVAWTWKNAGQKEISGDWSWDVVQGNNTKTHEVGQKESNELGLYDMSGNVREWCFDWYTGPDFKAGYVRACKGGGWMGDLKACEITYTGKFEANGVGADQGFRVCKNAD